MKWFALFWVYRREALAGWRKAQRKNKMPQIRIEPQNIVVDVPCLVEAAGAPVLTRNEARARLNLPPVGDK